MAHAKYPASSLSRLLVCPGSFSETTSESRTVYSDRGDMLHSFIAEHISTGKSFKDLDAPKDEIHILESCSEYFNSLIKTLDDPVIYVEQQVKLSHWDSCLKDVWGTADVIIETDTSLHVLDWKFGKGVEVEAEDNIQLLTYLAGATYKPKRKFVAHLVQPAFNTYEAQNYSYLQIQTWVKETLIPGIKRLIAGDTSLASGSHCRWCDKVKCREQYNWAVKTAQKVFDAVKPSTEVSDEEIANLLLQFEQLKTYEKALRKYAFKKAQTGKFPKHKLVAGRSIRKWRDEREAIERLFDLIPADQVFEAKLISPAKAEKLIDDYENIKDLIEKPKGKPILVPDTDKRRPYNPFLEEEK